MFDWSDLIRFRLPVTVIAMLSINLNIDRARATGATEDPGPYSVAVTILGRTSDTTGLHWPEDGRSTASVFRPCDLTVHLPGGKALSFPTDPILFVGREGSTVMSVTVPPSGGLGPLADKAREVERLLVAWDLTPDKSMRSALNEWKLPRRPMTIKLTAAASAPSSRPTTAPSLDGVPQDLLRALGDAPEMPATMRVGMELDGRTQFAFRVAGTDKSGWRLVVEISAKPAEWGRIGSREE